LQVAFEESLFPLGLLVPNVPIPTLVFTQATLSLQLLTSHLASSKLSLLGVPVLREGNIIRLSRMLLDAAQACSGIRSLMSLVILAAIYGHFAEPRLLLRGLLAPAAIPIAVVPRDLSCKSLQSFPGSFRWQCIGRVAAADV